MARRLLGSTEHPPPPRPEHTALGALGVDATLRKKLVGDGTTAARLIEGARRVLGRSAPRPTPTQATRKKQTPKKQK